MTPHTCGFIHATYTTCPPSTWNVAQVVASTADFKRHEFKKKVRAWRRAKCR